MGKLAYIFNRFPVVSETFIKNEIEYMGEIEGNIELFSLLKPKKLNNDVDVLKLKERTEYIFDTILAHRLLYLHFWSLVHYAKGYFKTLSFVWHNRKKPYFYDKLATSNNDGNTYATSSKIRRKITQNRFFHFLLVPVLVKKLVDSQVTHMHAHFADAASNFALLASLMSGIPYTFTAHAYDIFIEQDLMREKITYSSALITCTKFNKEFLLQKYPDLPAEKIFAIYHGLKWWEFSPPQTGVNKKPIILTVGRFVQKKGFEFLIEACGILKSQGVSFECWFVGDGPLREKLEAQVEQQNLQNNIKFWGLVPHSKVKDIYRQAKLFALPCIVNEDGDRDGIPNVLLEAMAMEIPVVSTNVSAIPELIEHDKTGFLVESGNAAALAEQMKELLQNTKKYCDVCQAGRERVQMLFDPKINVTRLWDVIKEAV